MENHGDPTLHLGDRELDEGAYAVHVVERLIRACPERLAASEDERRAHLLVQHELLQALGLDGEIEPFRFTRSLYANLALHFGLGTAGTVVSGVAPLAGAGLHLLAGTSYLLDSSRRAYLLRRLLPEGESQNLVVTIPARAERRLRLVLLAHVDAAFTGWVFDPRLVRASAGRSLPGPLGELLSRPVAAATYAQFVLAGLDLVRAFLGPLAWPLRPLEILLTLPALLTFVLNLQVVLRNQAVPGANDDLSGVAGLLLLARRFLAARPEHVELVLAATGAEEPGTGGARALARSRAGRWHTADTVVLGLDGLSGGELRYFVEGEVVRVPLAPWLERCLQRTSASQPRFAGVRGYPLPVGSTDALPFVARGYDGVTLGCVDPELGSPRHYHLPSDTADNLDPAAIELAVDYAEQLVWTIARARGATAEPPR